MIKINLLLLFILLSIQTCLADYNDIISEEITYFNDIYKVENTQYIDRVFTLIIQTDGEYPNPTQLASWSNSTNDKSLKSELAALRILSAEIRGDSAESNLVFKEYEGLFKDLQPYSHSYRIKSGLLRFSYNWLTENGLSNIPSKFVVKYPRAFDEGTSYFGSTRDIFFNVELEVFNTKVYKLYHQNLNSIRNPNYKKCSEYTREHLKEKKRIQHTALLLLNPEYYLSKTTKNGTSGSAGEAYPVTNKKLWVEQWANQGVYETKLMSNYTESKTDVTKYLVSILKNTSLLTDSDAHKAVLYYLKNLENLYFNGTPSSLKEQLSTYVNKGLTVLLDNKYVNDKLLLSISGEALSPVNTPALLKLITYVELHNPKLIQEIINQFASIDPKSLKLIPQVHFEKLKGAWGIFNKTPFMYAVQNNNSESYKTLKSMLPLTQLIELTEQSNSSWCSDTPQIGKRNVLTYALENSSYSLISSVLDDVGSVLIGQLDTAKRDVFYYLNLNTELNEQERSIVVARLIKFSI